MKKGTVNIKGKEYRTVAARVNDFREVFKPDDGWAIRTWLIFNEDDRVIIQASICDKDDHVVATGFAEEVRGSTQINRTSAVENCETSAIGRALAAFGLGGEEYCSADELVNALAQQSDPPFPPKPKPKEEPTSNKKNPIDEMERRLKQLTTLVEDPAAWWTNFLKHSDHSKGYLSLDQLERNLRKDEQWRLYDELKDNIEYMIKNQQEQEEELNEISDSAVPTP